MNGKAHFKPCLLPLVVFVVLAVDSAQAQASFFWTNTATSVQNWSAANWTNSTVTPATPVNGGSSGYSLTFKANTGTYTASNNFPIVPFVLNSLAFGAGTVTLTGNALAFTNNSSVLPAVTNFSGSTATLNNNLTLFTNMTFGAVNNLILNGVVTGNGDLTKLGGGTLTLTNTNTYTGNTICSAGTLQIGNGSNAAARAGVGVLTNAGILTLNLNGAATLGNSTVYSSGTIQNTGTGKVTITNNATIGGTIDGGSAGLVLAAQYTGSGFTPKGDMTFGNGANCSASFGIAYPGVTLRFLNGNASFWQIGGSSAANAVNFDIASGVTVSEASGQAGGSKWFNNLTGLGTFTWQGTSTTYAYVLGISTLGTLTVGGGGLSFGTGETNGLAGATRIIATTPVTFNSTSNNTYSGVMSGKGGLIKTNSNTLTLSGTNTYTGSTFVNAGTLVVATNGGLCFAISNSTNNWVTGTGMGAVTLNGAFTIDTSAVTVNNQTWKLVDVARLGSVTYGNSFSVAGSGWAQSANVWTKSELLKTWTFTEASGVLALATGTSLFVAPEGADTNPGTLAAPLRTAAAALPYLSSGCTLYLRAGTYRETLMPLNSGTAAAPITIAAYNNETVIFSGCDALTNTWTLTANGIYTNSVGWSLGAGYNQVFVDGAMQHEAQAPNWTTANSLLSPPTNSVTVYLGGKITSTSFGGKANGFYTGARFCGRVGSRIGTAGSAGWAWQTAAITNSSGNNFYVSTNAVSNFWWPDNYNDGTASDTGIGFVYGTLNLLDADGEWVVQTNAAAPHTLYLRIAGSANPGSHLVELKRRNWCVDFNNFNYVIVRGLTTRAGAIRLSGVGNVLTNVDAAYLSHFMTWADANNNPGGDTDWGRGIYVSGTSNVVSGCTVHDTSGSGVTLTGTGHLVTRSHIYNTDYSGTYASSLFIYSGSDDTITFNTMHDTGRDVLRPFGSGLSIMYNHLYNASKLCTDAGVIYAISVDGQDTSGVHTRIAYNWLHDNYNPNGDYRSPLIYFDRYCENFLVDHNVCWNNSGDNGIRLNWPNRYMCCFNNTLFKCDNFDSHDYKWAGPYKTGWTGWTSSAYPEALTNNLSLTSSPQAQLVDWATNDFRLKAGAAAINAGSVIAGITDGYVGTKPDLGAYEYAGAFWKAGTNGWAVEQPEIQTTGSASIGASNATCSGTLVSAGLSPTTVQLFWDLSDGGTSVGNWTNQVTLYTNYSGNFTNVTRALTGLISGAVYSYRFRASNTSGEAWSEALTFTTVPTPTILSAGFDATGGTLLLRTATLAGFTYRLESTTNLQPVIVWTPVSTTTGTGFMITNSVPVNPSQKIKFFHYIVQ
ncbi:MAG: autotransporter-associated beta strand repeat-containing protein [bacterium]